MKHLPANLLFCLILLTPALSCRKDTQTPVPVPARTVRYILYTQKDFSGENGLITFELTMKNGSRVLFDSSFAPMKISEIPGKTKPIVVDKAVPAGNENADLVVGFLYSIENVGNSWYLDTSKAGNPLKTIEYSFE
jgi:hypothetical protein